MEKRAIIAIVLSILVLIFYQRFFLREQPEKREAPKEVERIEPIARGPERDEVEDEEQLLPGPAERQAEEFVSKKIEEEERKPPRDVNVETKLYSAIFSSDGGRLKSWRLQDYKNRVENGQFVMWFQKTLSKVKGALGFAEDSISEEKPEPVELVTSEDLMSLPLAIEVEDEVGRIKFGRWNIDRQSIFLGGNVREGTILFRGRSREGLEISKRYWFYDDAYRLGMEVRVRNLKESKVKVRTSLLWFGMIGASSRYAFSGPVAMVDGQVKEIKEKKFRREELLLSGDITWFGEALCGKNVPEKQRKAFFVSLIVPKENEGINLKIGKEDEKIIYSRIIYPTRSIPEGKEAVYSYELYLGPKVIDLLKELNVEAEKVVRFGWFSPIAKILLLFINLTHRVTKNYGVDIIIISILLKIIFWPLTKKSYVSMKEMQKVQPEMAMLREKYKDDKARLNREMMDLYKRRKVNPLGGCLPMVVQIPIFFALYWALMGSIELRHAPFILWIKDLSYRDPIYISPILMGASMLWQQKMTPTMGDPRQAKMMMFMPIIFTFIFLSFPAGLVIYWLITNILTIAQQYLINKALK